MKPLVGISCCTKQFGVFGMPNHAASDTYVRATDLVVGGVPVLLPANGPTADIETLGTSLGYALWPSRTILSPPFSEKAERALRSTAADDPRRRGADEQRQRLLARVGVA